MQPGVGRVVFRRSDQLGVLAAEFLRHIGHFLVELPACVVVRLYLLRIEFDELLSRKVEIAVQRPAYVFEAEKVGELLEKVRPAQALQTALVGKGLPSVAGEAVDRLVVYQRLPGQRRAQHQSFEGPAAAQGDIGLTVGERSAHVDERAVEGQPLALVDRDGPGGLQRVLPEDAVYLFAYLLAVLVEFVARVGPFLLLEPDGLAIVSAADFDSVVGQLRDLSEHAVEVAVPAGGVVLHEHDLRSLLEGQFHVGGERRFGELAFGFGDEGEGISRQFSEFLVVDLPGLPVVGHEADEAVAGMRPESGYVSAVQRLKRRVVAAVVAYAVEQVEEAGVALAVDGFQLDGAVFALPERTAGEEVRGVVIFFEQLPFVVLDYGRELLQIAYHQHLHASERPVAPAVAAQHIVHRIQQVGPDHADLVDYEQVDAAYDVDLVLAEMIVVFRLSARAEAGFGNIRREGQLEERVYGHAAGVHGRDSGRREHYHALRALFPEHPEEGGLPGPGLSGQEQARARAFDEVPREGQFGVHFHIFIVRSRRWGSGGSGG